MHTQAQQTSANRADVQSEHSAASPPHIYLTVEQLSERHPAFTRPAIRNLIFKAETRQSSKGEIPGNGLAQSGAIIRLGRRVLINEGKFLAWVSRGGIAP